MAPYRYDHTGIAYLGDDHGSVGGPVVELHDCFTTNEVISYEALGVNPGLLAAMEQLIPLGRAGPPADAAGAVYLMCIPESDYASAQTLICGGGFFG